MSLKCQIFRKRLTFHNVLELSCDVRIIILFCLIAILPPNIKCAKLPNPQIRLLINDDDLLHEKTSRHEAAAAAAAAASASGASLQENNSGEHFNLYRSELKRLSYETIHRILRDENEPSYRREETELRYYQKRSPPAYEDSHQLNKRSTNSNEHTLALNYSKRNLREFPLTPQLVKELSSAASLDLSDNQLSSLNLSLLLNEHLHSLNLSNNSFTYIPLIENSSLKSLNLNSNNIKISPLPANVYLRNLFLSNNRIENLSSLNLSLLKNLEILDMSCNNLSTLETSFFPERMHNLKHLNLAHNQLGAIYRETFYNLLSLNTLLLGHNNITDIDYETFLALPNLQYLDLSYNRLKGKSIRALQGITGLVALNIAYNPELGPFMQEFVASWSLKELDASGTGLCQIPAALAQSVRSLKLTHNWLKVINCGDLDSYPLLQYLDLSFSHIEQIEDDALGRLEILEILMLDNNDLKRIPLSLPVSLEHLFLQNNNIMDIQPQSFQGLTSLKTLDLSHNKLLYLPDIALPKLQTLNLQSAEIRGISQGIVHTLPRLNELMLEDNPIKCSDLLGIAEWASTCRLRTNKDDLQDNGEDLANDQEDEPEEEEDDEGRKFSLKFKYLKMNNFYEKFEGEHCCQPNASSRPELSKQPRCASAGDKMTNLPRENVEGKSKPPKQMMLPSKSPSSATEVVNFNLKGSSNSSKVGNFNFNSMFEQTIPLPAKKAGKTLTGYPNKTATIVDVADKAITNEQNTTPNPNPSTTSAPATDEREEQQQILNNNTETYTETTIKTNTGLTTETGSAAALKPTTTLAEVAMASATYKALASADKPQQHSNSSSAQQMKTLPKTLAGSMGDAIKGIASGTTTDKTTMSVNDSTTRAITSQDAHQVEGAEQTLAESLRTANLPETLKQNVAESIIKKENKQNVEPKQHKETADNNMTIATAMATATATPTPTLLPTPGLAAALPEVLAIMEEEKKTAAYAMAINSAKPETDTTTLTGSTDNRETATTTTTPAALVATTISESMINHFKEKLQPEKEIKTKIGPPTEEIKSLQRSTMAPASSAVQNSNSTPQPLLATAATTATTSTMANEMLLKDPTKMLDNNSNTMGNKELYEFTTSRTLVTDTTNSNSKSNSATPTTATLKTTASAARQQTSTHRTSAETASQDKDLPSNNNMTHSSNGQSNKTLVTLHITMPITPNFVLHSKDQQQQQPPHTNTTQSAIQQQRLPEGEETEIAAIQQQQQRQQHQYYQSTTTDRDVNAKCMPSNSNECTSGRPQRQEYENVIGKKPTDLETTPTTITTTAAATMSTTIVAAGAALETTSTEAAATATATITTTTTTTHKHEPLQLHIKDRHLIGTPLLMHKGDNLMVAADELIKSNLQDPNSKSHPPSTSTSTLAPSPTTSAPATLSPSLPDEAKNVPRNLDRSQIWPGLHKTNTDIHHEPFEHKGETSKSKDYVQLKKSTGDAKAKKPSLIMKKMTIITKQHETTTPADTYAHVESLAKGKGNDVHHQQQQGLDDSHYQELKPLHGRDAKEGYGHAKHSTVNTPIHKPSNLVHEPQTFQHEHELLMQQILHDQQSEKASQSEQWSDVRKANTKDNHPGLILLVSSGLFVVLLLGLMHVYRCDVPWRRNSPAHHLRPHQRHTSSLDDDVHSFLSYNEGMQKWHHSTRLEAPYSSPLHNLHVRELQKTSATEKPASFKTSTSFKTNVNMRSHIMPRNNSQSSSATTRTTSPSSSAILDDETFYIEMTPPTGQFAQALQSELLPMELLNMAQTKSGDTRETSADLQTSLEDDYEFNAHSSLGGHHAVNTTNIRSELLTSAVASNSDSASALASTASASGGYNSNNKTLYNSRKFGLW